MKKKNMVFSCVAVAAIATFIGMKTIESHVSETSNLLKQNVEALTESEDGGYGYFTLHINETDVLNKPTGYCLASSWAGTEKYPGAYSTPHDHPRKKCCSR